MISILKVKKDKANFVGGHGMRVVVVDMQNTLFSDAISRALGNFSPDFQVYQSEHPQGTLPLCESVSADILLMETTSHSPWKLEERLQIGRAHV